MLFKVQDLVVRLHVQIARDLSVLLVELIPHALQALLQRSERLVKFGLDDKVVAVQFVEVDSLLNHLAHRVQGARVFLLSRQL